jgi:hypothetical protein
VWKERSLREEMDTMPAALRALLDAELAAGNEIVECGHGFPSPPAGAWFRLAKPLLSRPRKSGGGIDYYDRRDPKYSGEITDAQRFWFLLEPPHPPEPPPDMDAIREAHAHEWNPVAPQPARPPDAAPGAPETALQRFERSMIFDYGKWRDGEGYDLDALRAMSPAERDFIEAKLLSGSLGWRDVEALAALGTPKAKKALKKAMKSSDPEVRSAVMQHAPDLVSDAERIASLVHGIETGVVFGGLTQTLDQVEDFHPPEVIDALFKGALRREGEVAVHLAAMLAFVHGKAESAFDWDQRPFFLRFHTEDRAEREAAFRELCGKVGVAAETYVGG